MYKEAGGIKLQSSEAMVTFLFPKPETQRQPKKPEETRRNPEMTPETRNPNTERSKSQTPNDEPYTVNAEAGGDAGVAGVHAARHGRLSARRGKI